MLWRKSGRQCYLDQLHEAADAFARTYWMALALTLITVVPALFLPRKKEELHLLDEQQDDVRPAIIR